MIETIGSLNGPARLQHKGMANEYQELADLGATVIGGQENTDRTAVINTPQGWKTWRPAKAQSAFLAWDPEVWEYAGKRGAYSLWQKGLSRAPRYIVWALLRHIESGDVRPFGVLHLPAFKTRTTKDKMAFRLAERRAARWLSRRPRGVLLGDFNAQPGSSWMKRMDKAGNHQLPILPTGPHGTKIDHVYVNKRRPRAVNARTISGVSDHRALLVDLPLKVVNKPEPEPEPIPAFEWETREQWGARPPKNRRSDTRPTGVAVHYPGGGRYPKATDSHEACRATMRSWQRFHMDSKGSNDLEYGLVLCQHLKLMEARIERDKPWVRVGSNGTTSANYTHSSIQLMRGADDPPPTDAEILALAEAIVWLRKEGKWAPQITGHRDHFGTACPGDALYARLPEIRSIVARIERGEQPSRGGGGRKPTPGLYGTPRGTVWFRLLRLGNVNSDSVRNLQARLIQLGHSIPAGVTGNYGPQTKAAVKAFQRAQGWSGSDADGAVGPVTTRRLFLYAGSPYTVKWGKP